MNNNYNNEKERNFNTFFFDTQPKRMLSIGHIFKTDKGVASLVALYFVLYFDILNFFSFFAIFGLFAYIYQKHFNYTLKDRENLWVDIKIRKYLGTGGNDEV
jgi:hypothetical protein